MSSQLSAGTMAIPPDSMTAAGGPTTDSPRAPGTPEAPPRTFWRRALGDAFRRPGARAGAVWVAVLAFCGVFAPFLANSHPLLLKMDGQWVFPLFRHLTPADVVLLLATLGAAALAFARGLTFPQRAVLFLYVVAVLLVATATPWAVESIRDLQETAVGRFGRILGRAVAFFAGAVAALAVLVPLALWALKTGVPSRAKWAYVGAALFVGAVLVWRPISPPITVNYSAYREAERAGRVQFILRTPVPYSPTDYLRDLPDVRLKPPTRHHWMGTERDSADVLSRMIHAARIALTIGFISTGIAVGIGVVVGGLMGFYAGKVDIVGMRLIEIFESIPTLVLLLTIVAVFERNIYLMMTIIGLTGWTGNARFVRAEFLRLRNQDFVQAAIAAGLPRRSVIYRHMLPNGVAPVLVSASFGVAAAILTESVLSFLGLGLVQEPSWGGMLDQARDAGGGFSWWIAIFPGMAIFLTVFAYNLIGESLRDALDPKLRRLE